MQGLTSLQQQSVACIEERTLFQRAEDSQAQHMVVLQWHMHKKEMQTKLTAVHKHLTVYDNNMHVHGCLIHAPINILCSHEGYV